MKAEFAIIGGTGLYDAQLLQQAQRETVTTPYGDVEVTLGVWQGTPVAFLPRHGYHHAVPPHQVNYRANIRALQAIGVKQVLATAAVGSLRRELSPGSLVVIHDFIDLTKNRPSTFFDGKQGVVHIDMSDPYCRRLRQILLATAEEEGIPVRDGGIYVCTEGPRFETCAEIRAYASWGGDVVGMTSVPEVVLAKEAEMCYASVAVVTNYCSGIQSKPLTHEEVLHVMKGKMETVRRLFFATIARAKGEERHCPCPHALAELGTL